VRDWRSAIATITVRDQRYREHDPILGVVALKLSEIMKTSSQVTRWYPLTSGIGFGRVRISLLFRSVETKLPPNMLGWDVGTFEFVSDRITVKDYPHQAKIKLRTGGSTGRIPRSACQREDGGSYFDLSQTKVQLPVKYRYRSPVVFEFHTPSKRGAAAYAVLWLQHLVDNEDTPIDLPIWTTKRGNRLTQNYITEKNRKELQLDTLDDLTEVGRVQFTGRFSAGIDESHEQFVVDNNSRETFETWEACVAEGLRSQRVAVETPEIVQELHEKSLVDGRDVLRGQNNPEEENGNKDGPGGFSEKQRRTVAGSGDDAEGHDPVDSVDKSDKSGQKLSGESKTQDSENDGDSDSSETDDDDEDIATMTSSRTSQSHSSSKSCNKANKRSERRNQRGPMQWKPVRNMFFAKDEAQFALQKMKKKVGMGTLTGRQPDIETET
jgi:hypothetical protein